MAVQLKRTSITARPGRGLVTAYDPSSMGQLIDSFTAFTNVYHKQNSWTVRAADTEGPFPGITDQIQQMHIFNRVIDTKGTIKTITLVQTTGFVYDVNTSVEVDTVAAPSDIYFETVKNRVFYAGANNQPKIFDDIQTNSYPWGAFAPSNVLGYATFAVGNSNTKVIKNVCSVSGTTVTQQSGSDFSGAVPYGTGGPWVGKTIIVAGISCTIASVTDSTHLVITVSWTGPAGNQTTFIQYGALSWLNTFVQYAYAYYNPTTGHVSNASTPLQLSEQTMSNVDVYLSGIMTDPNQFAYGYSKIILFRTQLGGGGTLLPIALINNTNSLSNLNYQDEIPDTLAGTVVGYFPAPIINDPPPNFRYIASWDGRLWGIEEANPWRIRFSGDSGSILLGRPEECFPGQFFRDMPRGVALGFKVVGSTLVVMGDAETYFVDGSGDQGYFLNRLDTRGFGVTQRAIDQHPGDAGLETASAVYVSNDGRLWRHGSGGQLSDIGNAIQDKLDAVNKGVLHPYIVKTIRTGRLWLLALGLAQVSGYNWIFYDFDSEAWLDWGMTDSSFGQSIVADIADADGNLYCLVSKNIPSGTQNTRSIQNPSVTGNILTQPLITMQDFDMGDRIAKKSVQCIVLFTNSDDPNWAIPSVVYDNDVTGPAFKRLAVINSPRYRGPRILFFVPSGDVRQFHSIRPTFQFPITTGAKLYRFDIFWKPVTTYEEGLPS